jgi:hypothetical protein
MQRSTVLALVFAVALAGCSSSNGVSTASVLGNAPTPPPPAGATPDSVAAMPAAPASTLTDRALQVGSVSARAAKCGYNFDAEKLKAAYLSSEIGRGSDTSQAEKIYNVSYNGVMKAAADDPNFCSDRKTQKIKTDLNRLLAGDFEPPAKAVAVAKKEDDGGLFSGWFDGSSEDSGPAWGSNDWWDKQAAKTGQ